MKTYLNASFKSNFSVVNRYNSLPNRSLFLVPPGFYLLMLLMQIAWHRHAAYHHWCHHLPSFKLQVQYRFSSGSCMNGFIVVWMLSSDSGSPNCPSQCGRVWATFWSLSRVQPSFGHQLSLVQLLTDLVTIQPPLAMPDWDHAAISICLHLSYVVVPWQLLFWRKVWMIESAPCTGSQQNWPLHQASNWQSFTDRISNRNMWEKWVTANSIHHKPKLNTGIAWDNYDQNNDTHSGSGRPHHLLHDTVGIYYQNVEAEVVEMVLRPSTTCWNAWTSKR